MNYRMPFNYGIGKGYCCNLKVQFGNQYSYIRTLDEYVHTQFFLQGLI